MKKFGAVAGHTFATDRFVETLFPNATRAAAKRAVGAKRAREGEDDSEAPPNGAGVAEDAIRL